MKYYSVIEMIEAIDEPNRAACRKLYEENIELFNKMPGSSHNHQAWEGGYLDHIAEAMNICMLLYPMYNVRKLNFTLSDALLVIYVHDLEKLWRNGEKYDKEYERFFRFVKLKEYGFVLSDQLTNALEYVEGERNDYSNKKRVMNELAGFCHIADVSSARIWHDYGKSKAW